MLLAQYGTAWKCGLRSRSFQAVIFVSFLLIGAAHLGAAFSFRQPQVVALDLGLSAVRIGLVLLNLFWIQELVSRDIDRRVVVLQLSYPRPRWEYLLGRFLAVLALSLSAAVIFAGVLWAVVSFSKWGYQSGSVPLMSARLLGVVLLIWLEAAVVASFSLAVASVASTPFFAVLAGLAFALVGRMVGPVLMYLRSGAEGDDDLVGAFLPVVDQLRWILPDLSALDIRAQVLYGLGAPPLVAGDLAAAVGAAIAFATMALLLAVGLFGRRQFS